MRGKKTSREDVYRIIASYEMTRNYAQTAQDLRMPESTVRNIVDSNRNNPDFAELREKTDDLFVEKATRIIDESLDRLEQTVMDAEQRIPINQLATVIGILYDKRALSDNRPTENINISGVDVDKLAALAGFERR